jgi:hypothetical protein
VAVMTHPMPITINPVSPPPSESKFRTPENAVAYDAITLFWNLWLSGVLRGHIIYQGEKGTLVQISDTGGTTGCQIHLEPKP